MKTCVIWMVVWLLPLSILMNTLDNWSVFQYIREPEEWLSAQDVCNGSGALLLPELGDKLLENLDSIEPGDIAWLNAKNVIIQYGRSNSVTIKLSYLPKNDKLASYLCKNKLEGIRKYTSDLAMSWSETKADCKNRSQIGLQLLDASNPYYVNRNIYLFTNGVTFWIDKVPPFTLPTLVSEGLQMSEECWAVMRQMDGSLTYFSDDCSNRHRFICITGAEMFAPTITRLNKPTSPRTTEDDSFLWNGPLFGSYMSVILVSALVILAVLVLIYYLRGRWWRRRTLTVYMHSIKKKQISVKQPVERSTCCGHMQPSTIQTTLWKISQTDYIV